MPYTPVELRHVQIGRRPFGYNRDAVQRLLEEVADSFEEAWRERGELSDKVEDLEKDLAELRRREELLAQALVAAEQAASDVRASAHREAELIVGEAHREGRSIVRGAHAERARLSADTRRIEALLRAALGMVDDAGRQARDAEGEAPAPVPVWPGREDTREFPRPVAPTTDDPGELEAQAG
jgi:cell division septum initiation protein DivIVA